jgi:hypothetical protein
LQPDLYQAPSPSTGDREPAPSCSAWRGRFLFPGQVAETDDIGNPHLEKHVASAITLMKISATCAGFKKHLDKAMPIPKAQLALDLNDMDDDDE